MLYKGRDFTIAYQDFGVDYIVISGVVDYHSEFNCVKLSTTPTAAFFHSFSNFDSPCEDLMNATLHAEWNEEDLAVFLWKILR